MTIRGQLSVVSYATHVTSRSKRTSHRKYRRDTYTVSNVSAKDFDALRGLVACSVAGTQIVDVAVYDTTHGACEGQMWAVVSFDGPVRAADLVKNPFFAVRSARPTSRAEEFLWKRLFTRVV